MPIGKCLACKRIYTWAGRPLLRAALCQCKRPLEQTTYKLTRNKTYHWTDGKPPYMDPDRA